MMSRIRQLCLGLVVAASLATAGCGDDGGTPASATTPPTPGAPPAAAGARPGVPPAAGARPGVPAAAGRPPTPGTPSAAAARPGVPGRPGAAGAAADAPLKVYLKVEDVVPPDEAETIRRPFQPRDFAADITGNDNRDPFRSYVVRQTIGAADANAGGVTVATTEVCTAKNMVAPNPTSKDPRARKSYSIRDLRLVGIVMRGLSGYAIFRDPSGYGHLVRKRDCVGKEKARVTEIGAHIVKVEVIPEPGPNTLSQEPQERKFELYQNEIPLDEDLSDAEEEKSP